MVLGLYVTLFYPTIRDSTGLTDFLEQLPEAMLAFIGDADTYTTPEGFLNAEVFEFGQAVSRADFERIAGVSEVTIKDHHLSCNVTGSLDSLIKLAAKYTVVNIQSGHPALEEVFLTFYNQPDKTVD
jgi:hypothetical protein